MNLLLLTEGDAERWDSWSGSAKSVADSLRVAGHTVRTADVDLYGATRLAAAALMFAPNRKRWGVRYHLGAPGYRLRSRRAARAIARAGNHTECILQIGATFEPRGRGSVPYALFCDSNIMTSREGAQYGVSDAGWLRPAEFDAIRARELEVYRHAAVVMTISEWLRRSFMTDFGLPAERVHAVGAGPNLDLARIPAPRTTTRGGPPTVLFVGKQFERKGGTCLLRAFDRVRARLPEARLVIAGPTSPPPSQAGVEWIGNLDKNTSAGWARMAAAYRDADVFCLPSLFEPFGIVILEAMFFGLPCIGTDAWAIPEMIRDGETGYTFPRANEEALADRLCRLLQNPDEALRMGLAGRRRAEERFSWTTVAARMTEQLQAVCSRRGTG